MGRRKEGSAGCKKMKNSIENLLLKKYFAANL